jgi:hypothetical protein
MKLLRQDPLEACGIKVEGDEKWQKLIQNAQAFRLCVKATS